VVATAMLQRYRGQTRPQQNLGAAGRQFVSIPARMVIPHVAPSAFPFFKMGPSDKMDASDQVSSWHLVSSLHAMGSRTIPAPCCCQIFNRTLEFTILERRVLRKPGAMTVVLGPSDCGKSVGADLMHSLVHKLLQKLQMAKSRATGGLPSVIHRRC
jgi:hypothetical protein